MWPSQRILGFSLEELLKLDLSQVFADEGEDPEALLRKLRDPNPRVPFQVRQRCKDGSLLNVETRGHRLDLTPHPVLIFAMDDVTVRRKLRRNCWRSSSTSTICSS